MQNSQPSKIVLDEESASVTASMMLALFGLVAPLFTYFIAVSKIPTEAKVGALSILAFIYAVICGWSIIKFRATRFKSEREDFNSLLPEIDDGLESFDEAHAFFGNSLGPADMFRLVSSRVSAIVPHVAAMLLVPDANGAVFQIKEVECKENIGLRLEDLNIETGAAGLAFLSGEVEIDLDQKGWNGLVVEDKERQIKAISAIPMVHDGAVFGVFVIFLSEAMDNTEMSKRSLRNIGKRIAPLFLGSLSFERSLSNALTDPLTGLPNERAFFMVLENQLAESHRFRDERPLTVMTVDVRGFDEINRKRGHAAGDKVLRFVSSGLREQLRKMDFLARSANDEFLVVLPTATEETVSDILDRIADHFIGNSFPIDDAHRIKISLNFGTATFWKDGETAKQLLGRANLRKSKSKSEQPDNVYWFPKEYVN